MVGPGPSSSVQVLGPDQDQQNFENLGPIRTSRFPDLEVRGSLPGTGTVFKFQFQVGTDSELFSSLSSNLERFYVPELFFKP